MKKVVIIGAGPAGLTAALELLKTKKYKVIILEESNYVGGISRTVNYKGNRMDIGGHRFFSKSKLVNDFWLDILPMQGKKSYDDIVLKRDSRTSEDGPDPEKEDKVMLLRRRVSRIFYLNKLHPNPYEPWPYLGSFLLLFLIFFQQYRYRKGSRTKPHTDEVFPLLHYS